MWYVPLSVKFAFEWLTFLFSSTESNTSKEYITIHNVKENTDKNISIIELVE